MVNPTQHLSVKPTGAIRYRIQTRWFRKPLVVLQVQERRDFYPPPQCRDYFELVWRDATDEDMRLIVPRQGVPLC